MGSCQGCPPDAGDFIGHDLGTLNPLFERAAFVDFPGRVVDPSTRTPKRFRVEMVLGVQPGSIEDDDVLAFAIPPSQGPFADMATLPADVEELPPPQLEPVHVDSVERVLRDGEAIALIAQLDAADVARHAGSELIVQLDPKHWQLAPGAANPVFLTPMRFTFRISERGPDGNPPFLADVTAIATDPLLAVVGGTGDPVVSHVAPHSPLRFYFSETLYSAAPAIIPQDPLGFQPRPNVKSGGGFAELTSATSAGLVPAQEYCVSMLAPRSAALGPLALGTQDLSGEALVPPYTAAGRRRAARNRGDSTDVCFTTGPVRIESPAPGALLPVAIAPIAVELFNSGERCVGPSCPRTEYRVMVRRDDGVDDHLPDDWIDAGLLDEDDLEVLPKQGMIQGEIFVPGDIVLIDLPWAGMPPAVTDLCNPALACAVDFRIDRCRLGVCLLGDVIDLVVDPDAPPAPSDIDIEDADSSDGVIERICADMPAAEEGEDWVVTVEVRNGDCVATRTIVIPADGDNVTEVAVGNGVIRRCATAVAIPDDPDPADCPGADPTRVTVRRRDDAGNLSLGASESASCRRPPRKQAGNDARRSALAFDHHGDPHALYTDGSELVHARWDGTEDRWVRSRVACLCGVDTPPVPAPPNTLPPCAACQHHSWGWTVDLAINVADEPVACYSRAEELRDPSGGIHVRYPGWELDAPAEIRVAVGVPVVAATRFYDYSVASGAHVRNLGCSIEARRRRDPSGPECDPRDLTTPCSAPDYLAAYSVQRELTRGIELELSYLSDPAPGLAPGDDATARAPSTHVLGFTREFFGTPGVSSTPLRSISRDVAVDDMDAFWVVTADRFHRLTIVGEMPDGHGRGRDPRPGFSRPDPDAPFGRSEAARLIEVLGNGSRPRIAARADAEVAIAWSTTDRRVEWAHRTAEPFVVDRTGRPTARVGARRLISDLRGAAYASGGPGEEETGNLQNNGGVATADGLFDGIPVSVAFASGEASPLLAWVAGFPAGVDYSAVMLGRPGQISADGLVRHRVETIDGRVEGSAGVHVSTGPLGTVRLGYHNRLGPTGGIHYYREEDEDEIFRHPTRGRGLLADRCFAGDLFVQDQAGPRGERAGLDNAIPSLVPRPAIDPDPCGRTTDPGLALETTYRTVQLLANATADFPPDVVAEFPPRLRPGFVPDRRPPSAFARLEGETTFDFAQRTNRYRLAMFELMRETFGDLSFLDDAFPRYTLPSQKWNDIDTAPLHEQVRLRFPRDELLDRNAGEAGSLDAVFLALDELLDDCCGAGGTSRRVCAAGEVVRIDDPPACSTLPDRVAPERNPNGFFGGRGYTDTLRTDFRFDPYGVLSRNDFAGSFSVGDIFSDDFLPLSTGRPGEESGLLAAVLRGVRAADLQGVHRRADHVCVPSGPRVPRAPGETITAARDCLGVAAFAMPDGVDVNLRTPIAPEDATIGNGLSCPRLRAGARVRYGQLDALSDADSQRQLLGGAPATTRIPGTAFGCCSGYVPVACRHDGDCLGLVFGHFTFASGSQSFPPRCAAGFCEIPTRCRETDCDGGNFEGPPACELSGSSSAEDTSCDFGLACVPSGCIGTEPIYCDAREAAPQMEPLVETLCDPLRPDAECADPLRAVGQPLPTPVVTATGADRPPLDLAMQELRAPACGPATECVAAEINTRNPPIGRVLLGHYTVRMASVAGVLGGGDAIRGLLDSVAQAISVGLDTPVSAEVIREVRVEWIERADGDTRLQGALEIQVLLEDPGLTIAGSSVTVDPFRFRVRLQPYFAPTAPPLDACDGCGRRRPDQTVGFRVISAGLFQDVEDSEALLTGSALRGCDCFCDDDCEVDAANCLIGLGCKTAPTVGGERIEDVRDLPAAINRQIREAARAIEGPVSAGTYFLLSEPLAGGVLLGRREAVASLNDAPRCLSSAEAGSEPGSVVPAAANPDCADGAPVDPGGPRIADTIEVLRVRNGLAHVLGRENPNP